MAEDVNVRKCLFVNERLKETGLFGGAKREVHRDQHSTWRISPEPFYIDKDLYSHLEKLGGHLLKFYRACDRLYRHSLRGTQPGWVCEYLQLGKTERVVDYGRMNRFKNDLPLIIRPDIVLTGDGFVITELDSVPGGFGLVGALSSIYTELAYDLIGGKDGIVRCLRDSLLTLVPGAKDPVLAIVVSDESQDYWGEMVWMGRALNEAGLTTFVIKPREIIFREDGLYVSSGERTVRIDILYRFFELFDLKNIPKIDLILYAIRKEIVVATPPLKSHLEEKMLFALLHHPALERFWQQQVGSDTYAFVKNVFPRTWIMDPRPVPPHAVIPGLSINGSPVTDFRQLKDCTKKERELVIKPSGFSELAWGGRGVTVGHDESASNWSEAIENALKSFPKTPYILQEFHKGRKVQLRYYDFDRQTVRSMSGRTRLCPYYMVKGDEVKLAGILASVCPLSKKLIHGMVDAIMVPTALMERNLQQSAPG